MLGSKVKDETKPLYSADVKLPEITFRAIIISIILAVLLAASNAYLALKIGTTISASIPASIFAIAILRLFKNSNVLESNIIQTAASAGEGVASATAFILPAMLILGLWHGFPVVETTAIVFVGGLLGVLFSIPLRRIMLNLPTLKFPEGTAIGNVLRLSASRESHIKVMAWGGTLGGLVSLFQTGFRVLSDNLQLWFISGSTLFGCGFGFSSATLAAGYIIGIQVASSIFVGLVIGWLIILPILSCYLGIAHSLPPYQIAMDLWSHHLRFVGVGTMLVGGVWTLLRLIKPVVQGLSTSFKDMNRKNKEKTTHVLRTDHDISIKWVLIGSMVLVVALALILIQALYGQSMVALHNRHLFLLIGLTLLGTVVLGFVVSVICSYFSGLIGSTNNPLSGIIIIVVLLFSLLYLLFFRSSVHVEHIAGAIILVSLAVATMGAISNENLQDLKAGQMVGATPWKQQVMLGIGAGTSAFILAPVLNLLFHAYGIGGVFPHPGMNTSNMLTAPQASLMAAVAKGVLIHKLPWNMLLIGCCIAIVVISIDHYLNKRFNHALPCLAVGLGIYLPPEIIMPIFIGGLVSWLVNNKVRRRQKHLNKEMTNNHQRGVLFSCGMVAGSSIMGVVMAIPFVIEGSSNALVLVPPSFFPLSNVLGTLAFISLCICIYRIGTSKEG